MIGNTIGRYQITKKLGDGGMAIVYQAYDTHLDSHVALKIIRKERLLLDDTPMLLQRFEAEAKRVARLSNPNIIPILDYGEYEGTPYLVMKYIPGGTLKDRMGKPVHPRDAARLLIPIARALSYAHQQGIVHRDVKPGNILLTETGEPMLSDFGIAMLLLEKDAEPAHDREAILGTPEYMAPEQALGKPVDHRADIYALGLIFYEMITGRMPFTADTPISVLMKHIHEPLPPARQFVPDLPEIAHRVVARALEKSPADRFATMDDFGNALKQLAQSQVPRRDHTIPLDDDELEEPWLDTDKTVTELPQGSDVVSKGRITRWAVTAIVTLLAIMLSGVGVSILQANRQPTQLGFIAAPIATKTPDANSLEATRQSAARQATGQAAATATAFAQTSTAETAIAKTTTAESAAATEAFASTLAVVSTAAAAATETAASMATAMAANPTPDGTQGSETLQAMVRALAEEGLLSETDGRYSRLADFEESWAQIGWYQWWFTGYELTDFVLSAHTAWESASETADWFNAGCGFVFREKDAANHYMIYMGLDGFVYLRGYIEGRFRELGKEYYKPVANVQGEADVVLVVSGDRIRYYVNGERVLQRRNNELRSGNLSYTLVSGTNRTFGTRCSISDVELWQPDIP